MGCYGENRPYRLLRNCRHRNLISVFSARRRRSRHQRDDMSNAMSSQKRDKMIYWHAEMQRFGRRAARGPSVSVVKGHAGVAKGHVISVREWRGGWHWRGEEEIHVTVWKMGKEGLKMDLNGVWWQGQRQSGMKECQRRLTGFAYWDVENEKFLMLWS